MTHATESFNRTGALAESRLRLFAVVLAAGAGSRFGATKQLAVWQGKSLVARAMRAAEQLCAARSVLVAGYASGEVHDACAPLQGFLAVNDDYASGLGSSVACGVTAVCHAADGVLLMLADQPLVTCEHLEELATAWRDEPDCAVATGYAGDNGVPAIFPAADFAGLMALTGDRGAKTLLAAHQPDLRVIDCEAAAVDIDCPADLDAL